MGILGDILSGAGYVLDTPGALTRGAIGNIADLVTGEDKAGARMSGRDLLERLGLIGSNQDGLDAGDAAGFLTELLIDPLNLVGGAVAGKFLSKFLGKGAAAAKAAPQVGELLPAVATPAVESVDDDLAELLGRIVSGKTPEELVEGLTKQRFQDTRQGVDWLANHYLQKASNPETINNSMNIINPRSGIPLWDEPARGMSDLFALLNGKYAVRHANPGELSKTARGGYASRAMVDGFRRDLNRYRTPRLLRDTLGNIQRTGERSILLPQTRPMSDTGANVISTGVHEGKHYLQDSDNISTQLLHWIGKANSIAERQAAKGRVRGAPPERLAYVMQPDEVMSRIAQIRHGLEQRGLQELPYIPGSMNPWTSVSRRRPMMIDPADPSLRTRRTSHRKWVRSRAVMDRTPSNILDGTGAEDALLKLESAYGPRLLRTLLRTVPVAAPAAVGLYGYQQSQSGT